MTGDTFGTRRTLPGGEAYFSLPALAGRLGVDLSVLPHALRVLLENLLRHEGGGAVSAGDVEALARWTGGGAAREVAFHPARVLMPDSSGIPLLIDLAAMRDAVAARGADPALVGPRIPVDLVIDHSVRADHTGSREAFTANLKLEMARNGERYGVVRWATGQFRDLRVVPPANGIVHQVNLEYLADVVALRDGVAFPDSLVGMDSHTPMINGLGVFGWGVGGIEAAAAMLGQPVSMLVPRVVGCRVVGRRRPGVTCTDIVLSLTQALRGFGVLEAVVEFCGPGLDALSLPDRATIANMAAEYGATMGFFPWDAETVRFLRATARPEALVARVERYATAQELWRGAEPRFDALLEFDLGTVEPCLAGPSRPEARVPLRAVPASFREAFPGRGGAAPDPGAAGRPLADGDVVIAAISSCTNTSNPFQVVAAGLLARNAAARGLRARSWVKTSVSPGSRTVTAMLARAELLAPLEAVGFHVVGYGCMTCGGGAGPLPEAVTVPVAERDLVVLGVISTNRNFEGRLHPAVRGTYLASPPLVVAYALAGTVLLDPERDPLAFDAAGAPVFLRELWPSDAEVNAAMDAALSAALFRDAYGAMADGGPEWKALTAPAAPLYPWDGNSLFLKRPPFLDDAAGFRLGDVRGGRALLVLGDDVTTDHISPGGAIPEDSPSGRYLLDRGVSPAQFSTYVGRRANHEVMHRGTFANIRLRNRLVPGTEGGRTRHAPGGEVLTVFDAAERYRAEGVPLLVVAGRNYGCGSSRDWAAKGTALLGIRAVIAESFERIHRSNLLGMGVLPLQLPPGTTAAGLELDGTELLDVEGVAAVPGATVRLRVRRADGRVDAVDLLSRADTAVEADWLRHGGILPHALRLVLAREPTEA